MEFRIVVKGLIVDNNKILLVKRSENDEYNPAGLTLPGGFIGFGEKPKEAIVREVNEETGLNVKVQRVNTVWSSMDVKNNIQVVGITFVCRPLSKEININEELSSFQWVNIDDNLDLPKWLVKELKALKTQ